MAAAEIAAEGLAGMAVDCFAEAAVDCFAGTAVDFVGTVVDFAEIAVGFAETAAAAEAECFAGTDAGFVGTAAGFVGTGENSAVETDLDALPGIEELGFAPVVVEAEIDELRLAAADYSELSGPKDNDVDASYDRIFSPGLFS